MWRWGGGAVEVDEVGVEVDDVGIGGGGVGESR